MDSETEKASGTAPGSAATGQGDAPPPAECSVDPVRRGHTWGMACHLAALAGHAGVPMGTILGPLLVWLIQKDRYPFADDQGRESVNFQLPMLAYSLGAALLICLCIGLPLLILLQVLNLVIVASVRASQGEKYRYPLAIRFLR